VTFPTPHEVGVHIFSSGLADAHNNPQSVFTPALDADGTSVAVYGWQPAASSELSGHYEERVTHDVDLLVPPGFPASERDVIDLPSGQYRVIGVPRDFTRGPFGFMPGSVLALKKVDG
jgi:hypothetical protein